MFQQLINTIKQDDSIWEEFRNLFIEREIPSKTILLREGEIASHVHFIKKGCLRLWFNKDGKDITTQFFFENQPVASIESFSTGQPSLFTLESIEPSVICSLSKENFDMLHQKFPQFRDGFNEVVRQRFSNYARLFLSRIKDTPRERYEDLLVNHPEIIKRVPQHYIASYLGITPISLSRIRKRRETETSPISFKGGKR
jgi:CRP-like cAMP-binding protein